MRILLPIIKFPPDVNPTGLPIAQVSEGLVKRGHEVSVITSFPTTGALWGRRWDVVLCPNGSFATAGCALFLQILKSAPFIYNVQDIYPGLPARAGRFRSRCAMAAMTAMENLMCRKAAHITVMTPAMHRRLVRKRVPEKKISTIPNFADTEFIRPLPRDNPFAREHGLSGKFVVAYAEHLGYAHDLAMILKAAHLLRSNGNLLFLIVGDGVANAELEREAADLQLDNLRFMPLPPRERVPWLRASLDVQVSLYRQAGATDSFSSPICETMASGRPLIAAAEAGSAVDQIIGSSHGGICIAPGDARDLALAIVQLYHDPMLCARMGESGRWYAEKYHSKRAVVERYDELLKRIAGEHKQ
jgi:colanic acid biosynthesis glycosyl transferase WcaI